MLIICLYSLNQPLKTILRVKKKTKIIILREYFKALTTLNKLLRMLSKI